MCFQFAGNEGLDINDSMLANQDFDRPLNDCSIKVAWLYCPASFKEPVKKLTLELPVATSVASLVTPGAPKSTLEESSRDEVLIL